MTANEEWRPIDGYEGVYEVSNLGRVRSLDRTQALTGRWGSPIERRHKGRLLADRPGKNGYLRVQLNGRDRYVHRLVAAAFIGPAPEGMDVCHYDGDRTNNAITNLRYATRLENMADQRRHGTHANSMKEHCIRGHVLCAPNLVAYKSRQGRRHCLACHRALSILKRRSGFTERDVQVASNEQYLVIMLESRREAS